MPQVSSLWYKRGALLRRNINRGRSRDREIAPTVSGQRAGRSRDREIAPTVSSQRAGRSRDREIAPTVSSQAEGVAIGRSLLQSAVWMVLICVSLDSRLFVLVGFNDGGEEVLTELLFAAARNDYNSPDVETRRTNRRRRVFHKNV